MKVEEIDFKVLVDLSTALSILKNTEEFDLYESVKKLALETTEIFSKEVTKDVVKSPLKKQGVNVLVSVPPELQRVWG